MRSIRRFALECADEMARDFLLLALERLAQIGITPYLEDDLGRLAEHNRRARRDRWFPLMPMFDPDLYQGGRAFWVRGVEDASGETVMTIAARHYRVGDSLKEQIESLGVFYSDPAVRRRAGESCRCAAPAAARIAGSLVCGGAGWCRRDYSGQGFARWVPRLSRMIAHELWDLELLFGLVDRPLVEKGLPRQYGYRNVEEGVAWRGAAEPGDLDLWLMWATRAEIEQDIKGQIALAGRVPPGSPK